MVDKKEDKASKYELVEVPTQTEIVVRNTVDDSLMNDKEVLLKILNALEEIKKAVG